MNLYSLVYRHPQHGYLVRSVVIAESQRAAEELAQRDIETNWKGYGIVTVEWCCAIEHRGVVFLVWEPWDPTYEIKEEK